MLVKGHSGFGIELLDELTIRKSAPAASAERLRRQIEKQVHFHQNHQTKVIRVPRVFRMARRRGPGSFHADMEFVAARDFIQFLSEADRRALDNFVGAITGFVRGNLARCATADVAGACRHKLAELAAKTVPAKYVRAARRMCRQPVIVPAGPCHGDLTLSNLLFKSRELYLLDFLDCFVESPLQDIVKLRQDTCFGWSLQMYHGEFNRPKILIALRYLDQRIAAAFQSEEWYRRHYDLFQLVNLMRVLPYCRNGNTQAFITEALDRMLASPVLEAGATS